ncbi:MAG: S9 family peptidase [Acidimicrobiia bacterium]
MTSLTPETLWSIPRLGPPLALEDGRLLVPVTTHDEGTPSTTLWRIEPDGGERRRFASGRISGFALSPDGRTVAYLEKLNDHRQVQVQPLDGGEARGVADLPLGAIGVRWTPDGDLLALATLRQDRPTLEETSSHEPEDNPVSARVTEDATYRYWDMWLEHVYHPVRMEVDSGRITDLTPGATRFWAWPNTNETIDEIDISPDGSLVAFVADDSAPPHRQLCWSLFLMDADGSNLRRLDGGREGHSSRPRFSSDGTAIIYGYQPEPDFYACQTRLIRHDLATGSEERLVPDWNLSPHGWILDDKGRLVALAEDAGRSKLYRIPEGAGLPEALTEHGWVTSPTVAPDGTMYVLAQSLSSPPEVHRVAPSSDPASGGTRAITDFTTEAMGEVELGRVREVMIEGADGDPIQMWVIDPPGVEPDQSQALVHMIHGGPHGVFGDTWHWRWNAQAIAAGGYRVAHVNFHGSTGWGEDFTRSIHGAWGDLPFRDIEAATDHLVGAGLADEDRIAVTGGSYGGYLTAWITSQSDRYACAIAHAAVTNFGGMYASDLTFGRRRSYGAEVWEDLEAVQRWSPAAHAAGYSTPTLVVHGHLDQRVPLTQGLELYGILVGKGVPARLVAYPDENHWILSRANSIHWYGEFLAWLDRWL